MRLVTLRRVPARLEVASQSGSQPAKTLLLFKVCSARLCHSQPSATLCGFTSTLSIIYRPTAPCKQRLQDTSAAVTSLFLTDFTLNAAVNLLAGLKMARR